MRPRTLDEFVGQETAAGAGAAAAPRDRAGRAALRDLLGAAGLRQEHAGAADRRPHARPLRDLQRRHLRASPTCAGRSRRRAAPAAAGGRRTILFVDEIHRFNKAQQDAFLPHVEDGTIVLIGATTENPYFEVNTPLLSRARIFRFEALSDEDLRALIRRALAGPRARPGRMRRRSWSPRPRSTSSRSPTATPATP